MKEKILELKKHNRINNAKHIRKEEQEKYNTRGIEFGKRKTHKNWRTDKKKGKIRRKTKNQNDGE